MIKELSHYSDEKDAKILNELLTNRLAVCQCESAELGWPFCKLTYSDSVLFKNKTSKPLTCYSIFE